MLQTSKPHIDAGEKGATGPARAALGCIDDIAKVAPALTAIGDLVDQVIIEHLKHSIGEEMGDGIDRQHRGEHGRCGLEVCCQLIDCCLFAHF
jgi:hypothetical protein